MLAVIRNQCDRTHGRYENEDLDVMAGLKEGGYTRYLLYALLDTLLGVL
jgi:hypothetical protein